MAQAHQRPRGFKLKSPFISFLISQSKTLMKKRSGAFKPGLLSLYLRPTVRVYGLRLEHLAHVLRPLRDERLELLAVSGASSEPTMGVQVEKALFILSFFSQIKACGNRGGAFLHRPTSLLM